jgi:selenocysteine lyase/cysteine desulfurase
MKTGAPQQGSGYFLYHSIGMYPGKSDQMAAAFAHLSEIWGRWDDGQWGAALALRQEYLDLWGDLIAAPPGTLTSAENVTTALFSLIGALPRDHLAGRSILVAADCFPSLHFLLAGLQPAEAWVRDEDIIAAWDRQVGLALLTQVTSTASFRCDLPALVAHGRRMGSLVGVDVTQGIGLIPWRVDEPAVDFAVSSTLKWLCGTSGAGILYVRAPLLATCRPELRGWFSQENIFSWDLDSFRYAGDARRFDHGTPSVLACVGSVPALRWHRAQPPGALLAHNRALGAQIIAGLHGRGLTLVSPAAEGRRGGSLMFRVPADTPPARLVDDLRTRGLYLDCRGQVLRISPGSVTTAEGAARLVEALGGGA